MTRATHSGMQVKAILFDKDGTLFDFGATWNGWAARMIQNFAQGDTARATALADALRFDLDSGQYFHDSFAIAGTNSEVAEAMLPHIDGWTLADLERFLAEQAAHADLAEAVPLGPFLATLRARGLATGVMTNDAEMSARSQLDRVNVLDLFDFVAGFDSGFGMKPDPDPLLAFCAAVGVPPQNTMMVGDSTHDLIAGRAAGMQVVGVLTGMASRADLTPYADLVLGDIGGLLDILGE